jgi:hypothetical protein
VVAFVQLTYLKGGFVESGAHQTVTILLTWIYVSLVTAANASFCSTNLPQGGFVEHISWTYETQQSVTKIISLTIMN